MQGLYLILKLPFSVLNSYQDLLHGFFENCYFFSIGFFSRLIESLELCESKQQSFPLVLELLDSWSQLSGLILILLSSIG